MRNIQDAKEDLRNQISSAKKKYSPEELYIRSQEVLSVVEITGAFQDAKRIFLYNSLSDEVQTSEFIEKWAGEKDIYLPAIENDTIVLKKYTPSATFSKSALGILEPSGDNFSDYKKIDLIIVPGVAFDRQMNRLGRGKGYYDRFLTGLIVPKMGICFDFQLLDKIPSDSNDVKMNYLVSENELIW